MTASSSASVYGRNAQAALSAAPLELKLAIDNPFCGFDFFETAEGGLLVRRWRLASVFDRMRVFPNKTFHRSVP
jgi:hypothetical protein